MIRKEDFEAFLNSIKLCYSEECQDKLPTIADFPLDLFANDSFDILLLEKLSDRSSDIYLKSVLKRILGILLIQKSREEDIQLDLKRCWHYISESIRVIRSEDTISSIGSQGFLSIPLFKFMNEMSMFEFIRLHIWDKSLESYIDQNASTNFSIHTH